MNVIFYVDVVDKEEVEEIKKEIIESGAKVKKVILKEDVKIIKTNVKNKDIFFKNYRKTTAKFKVIGYYFPKSIVEKVINCLFKLKDYSIGIDTI